MRISGRTGYNFIRSFDFDITGEAYDSYYCNRLYNSEGYTEWFLRIQSGPKYYYFRRDHIGNNREVWLASYTLNWIAKPALTVQRTQYYPSGLPWASNTGDNPGLQNKKYNGKEFVEMHGLDVTDLGWRGQYPAINRFTTIDRFAEKYPSQSPYVHAGNNPVNYVDVNGDSIWVSIYNSDTNSNNRYYYGADSKGNRGFIGADGKLYSGNDNFVSSLTSALSDLSSAPTGKDLVDYLSGPAGNVSIVDARNFDDKGNKANTDKNYIRWNPESTNGGLNILGTTDRPAFVGLGHEMAHIEDKWMHGKVNNSDWYGGKIADQYATDVENKIRAEHGISLREYYTYNVDIETGTKSGNPSTRLIDRNGRGIYYGTTYYQVYRIGNQIFRFPFNH